MAQQIINNEESGLNVRNAINQNFTELYGSLLVPVKIPGISSNTNQALGSNVFLSRITVTRISGGATLRIGTTPNGQDLLSDTVISGFMPIQEDMYFAAVSTIYFTFSGSAGTINVRMDIIPNYF